MRPFSELNKVWARGLRYVLHDVDDTITNEGKLLPEAFAALWRLREAGIRVIPVTGRPAGWCDMMIRQWPVDAVIGENGALVYYQSEEGKPKLFIHPSVAPEKVHAQLQAVGQACLAGVPGCRVAMDQFSRRFDLAIDFCEDEPKLGLAEAQRIRDIALGMGAQAKISSIHVNIWFGQYDKLAMAKLFFEEIWGVHDLFQAGIFFGDSPNDEPMFSAFPIGCGVANIEPFLENMEHRPGFVTQLPGGEGFAEAVRVLLALREEEE